MKSFLSSILILFCLELLPALTDDYIFTQLTDQDGLSQSTICATIQDRKGYLWFGTIDGLNRYDGYEFKVYSNNPADSSSISDNFVSSLFEDSEGYLWVGTVNGYFNRFDRKTDRFKRYFVNDYFEVTEETDPAYYNYPLVFSRNHINSITAIEEDSSGYLWIGTWGNGIIRFNKKDGKAIHFYHEDGNDSSLSANRIRDILIDNNGEIWIATFGGGISKIKDKTKKRKEEYSFIQYLNNEKNDFSLNDNEVLTLCEDKDENLWIGTFSGGLNKLDAKDRYLPPENSKLIHYTKKLHNDNTLCCNTVMAIAQDKDGYLWLGTFGGGIDRLNINHGSFTHYYKAGNKINSLPDNEILSLFVDRSGILWVGSHLGEGVTKVQKNTAKFELINSRSSEGLKLNDDVVWSVYKDRKEKLWVGTYRGGLNKLDLRSGNTNYFINDNNNPNSISNNHIRSIAEDNFGNIWIGTYNSGLNRLNPLTNKIDVFKNDPGNLSSLSANQVLDIYVESDSVIWVATYGGGLNKLTFRKNTGGFLNSIRVYKNAQSNPYSISDDRVYVIYKDIKGIFWIGTYGGGLNRFDPNTERFECYKNDPDNENSISSNLIMSILEDSDGNFWLGTSGGGLNKFNLVTQKFTHYSTEQGLTSSVVYGILADKHNNLWMSTDDGIIMFNPVTEKFTQFGLEDGLQSLEFSGGAYFKDGDGVVYFGGINGLNYFNPDSIIINTYIPPVVICGINIFDKKLKGEIEELILSYNQNFVSIEFSALDFSNPPGNRYSFILEGFQYQWHHTDGSRRIATYTNLPAGEYIFRVIGTNSDGIWNEQGAFLKIIINPPFWQTWWFVTLVVILIGFLIYYISTIRIKNQLAIEKIKTRIASDLHDNIGAGLTEISILSEVAVHGNGGFNTSVSKELRKISETARQLVDNMSDIVWVVNPRRDSLHDLIIKIKDSYNEFFSSVGISFQVKNVEKSEDVKLPMEYKQNLLLMFKEAINNAIKHSNCKKIVLEAAINNDVIKIAVTDDGNGFNENNIRYGNGMKNMVDRAKQIGGEIVWNSNRGEGTQVRFAGKISRINKLKTFFNT